MEPRHVFIGSFLVTALIGLVTAYALYNEGILAPNTYTNTVYGYTLNIPRSYRLGTEYMTYANDSIASDITIASGDTPTQEEAEIVILTTQNKSTQQKNVSLLRKYPTISLGQVCDCVVIAPTMKPEQMEQLIIEREIKAGNTTRGDTITLEDKTEVPVYRQPLGNTNEFTGEFEENGQWQEKLVVYFDEAITYHLDNQYAPDQDLSFYGLIISHFTSESQTASLTDVVEQLTFLPTNN